MRRGGRLHETTCGKRPMPGLRAAQSVSSSTRVGLRSARPGGGGGGGGGEAATTAVPVLSSCRARPVRSSGTLARPQPGAGRGDRRRLPGASAVVDPSPTIANLLRRPGADRAPGQAGRHRARCRRALVPVRDGRGPSGFSPERAWRRRRLPARLPCCASATRVDGGPDQVGARHRPGEPGERERASRRCRPARAAASSTSPQPDPRFSSRSRQGLSFGLLEVSGGRPREDGDGSSRPMPAAAEERGPSSGDENAGGGARLVAPAGRGRRAA